MSDTSDPYWPYSVESSGDDMQCQKCKRIVDRPNEYERQLKLCVRCINDELWQMEKEREERLRAARAKQRLERR